MWIRYTGYIQTNMAVTWPLVHTSTGTCQPHAPRKRDGDDRFTQLRKLARMPRLETDTVMYIHVLTCTCASLTTTLTPFRASDAAHFELSLEALGAGEGWCEVHVHYWRFPQGGTGAPQ